MAYNPYAVSFGVTFDDGTKELQRIPYNYNVRGYKYYTVREGETLQSIAQKIYRDSGYWMVLAEYNAILHPFKDLEAGMQLVVPY